MQWGCLGLVMCLEAVSVQLTEGYRAKPLAAICVVPSSKISQKGEEQRLFEDITPAAKYEVCSTHLTLLVHKQQTHSLLEYKIDDIPFITPKLPKKCVAFCAYLQKQTKCESAATASRKQLRS